ncbi:TPA: hypothetical protein UL920_004169 [Stenotrophomonas maltophilia]|nr:hypothetical protein [Stenotrophomonas maltophilia]HEL4860640.1 hypothetical protein [Stenotrophomonas maltophilia]HEL7632500.1 hypothetical protein [Stenotrophomonas maltophilia]HEL7636159.1 hypothetical protein [Stenotrophomonas maltophilia]
MSWIGNLWRGVSPCMEPGVGDCVVWWDGWAVAVALCALLLATASLVVAFWGVLATVVSSIAVWRLGQRANFLAESGAEQVRIEREAIAAEQAEGRAREAVIVLSYISSELTAIYPSVGALAESLKSEGAEERFVHSKSLRKIWADDLGALTTPRIDSALQLLKGLPSDLGGRIARVLGDVRTLQEILKSVAPSDLDDVQNEDERAQRENWLRTLYRVAEITSSRAMADIAHCSIEAARAAHTIGDAPAR